MHSIGAALFARKDQIHFFNEIGYLHNPFTVRRFRPAVSRTEPHRPFQHCPQGEVHTQGKCWCDPKKSIGEFSPPPIVLYHAAITYAVPGDRSRVVLLFGQIRRSIQVIAVVFSYAEMGAIRLPIG